MHSKQTSTLHSHFNFLSLSGHRAPDLSRRNPSSKILISMKQSVHNHSQNEMFSRSAWFTKRYNSSVRIFMIFMSVSSFDKEGHGKQKNIGTAKDRFTWTYAPHATAPPWWCHWDCSPGTMTLHQAPRWPPRRRTSASSARSLRCFHDFSMFGWNMMKFYMKFPVWLVLDLNTLTDLFWICFFFKNTKYHKSTK